MPSLLPLRGLRILDCSTGIAGPYAAKLWLDAGAEVIKVEPPGGDSLRRFTASGHELAAGEDGAVFRFLNASKRSIVIDLDAAEGRELLTDLASGVDLLLESFGPDYLADRGLDVGALQTVNPALGVVSISPWGLAGPWARRPATEFTLQAWSGSAAYRGLPERGPVAASGRVGEWAGGVWAAVAGLCAWMGAHRTGRGQHIDLSLFEVVIASMTIANDLEGQWVPGPLDISIETPSIEPAKDGWVGLCTYTSQQWQDFCQMIGRPEIAEDEQFAFGPGRMEKLSFIQEAMHTWTREHTVAEIIEHASALRIPVAPVADGRNVLELDHFVERGVFQESPHGFRAPRPPYRLSSCQPAPFGRAPGLDEHAAEIRAERKRSRTANVPEGKSALPLEGLRVVDLSAFWAGPMVSWTLAAQGADVVKIESIQRPDGMRFAGCVPNQEPWEWSWVFHGVNTGKRSITLNLQDPEGKQLLRRMIEGADVVLENFSVRVMEHFGLDWETLHGWNPRLIVLRMPAWGLDGPWRDRTGFASNVEHASGMAWITGYRDLPLIVRGVCDPLGGMHGTFALLLALEERRRTGEGQLVECALVEPALNVAAAQVLEWTAYGEVCGRTENRGPDAAPQGIYRCAGEEAFVALAVTNDREWAALCRVLGDPAWSRAESLATVEGRRTEHDSIDAELGTWFGGQTRAETVELLLAADVPAAPLTNGHSLMPNPQLEARGFYQTLEHPRTGKTRYPALAWRSSETDDRKRRTPPPTLGQHNDEVLGGELGLDRKALDRLREKKVIGEWPAWLHA